jgi:hypothetical protein
MVLVHAHRVPGTSWACLGVFVLSKAGLDSIQGGYRRDQGGARKLADMLKERGGSQRDEWHGGVLWLGMMKF